MLRRRGLGIMGLVGLTIDDAVFASSPNGEDANEAIIVTAADQAAAKVALERAVARFWRVDGLGVEHDDGDYSWQDRPGLAAHSCKYDSGVTTTEAGLEVWLDCQDLIPMAMGETYVRILREEFERAGVEDAEIRVPPAHAEEFDDEVPSWVRRYPDAGDRPIGFPTDIELPAGATLIGTETRTFSGCTVFGVQHDGSWMATMTFAVDDAEGALDEFAETMPQHGYEFVHGVRSPHEAGYDILAFAFAGHGLEVEMAVVAAPAPARMDRKFRSMPDKGLAQVAAFQRDPEAT